MVKSIFLKYVIPSPVPLYCIFGKCILLLAHSDHFSSVDLVDGMGKTYIYTYICISEYFLVLVCASVYASVFGCVCMLLQRYIVNVTEIKNKLRINQQRKDLSGEALPSTKCIYSSMHLRTRVLTCILLY